MQGSNLHISNELPVRPTGALANHEQEEILLTDWTIPMISRFVKAGDPDDCGHHPKGGLFIKGNKCGSLRGQGKKELERRRALASSAGPAKAHSKPPVRPAYPASKGGWEKSGRGHWTPHEGRKPFSSADEQWEAEQAHREEHARSHSHPKQATPKAQPAREVRPARDVAPRGQESPTSFYNQSRTFTKNLERRLVEIDHLMKRKPSRELREEQQEIKDTLHVISRTPSHRKGAMHREAAAASVSKPRSHNELHDSIHGKVRQHRGNVFKHLDKEERAHLAKHLGIAISRELGI